MSNLNLKILVLGDGGVGKSCFIKRLTQNTFSPKYKPTQGLDFKMKNFSVDANIVKLQVWDISNADRTNGLSISSQNSSQNDNNNTNNINGNHLDQIGRLFYKNALGLFLVMDLSKPLKDDNSIKRWVDELNSKVTLPSGKKLPILLVCTKSDLVNEDQIDLEMIESLCKENGIGSYVIASAKTGQNIEKAATKLTREILRHEDAFIPVRKNIIGDVNLNLANQHDNLQEAGCCFT